MHERSLQEAERCCYAGALTEGEPQMNIIVSANSRCLHNTKGKLSIMPLHWYAVTKLLPVNQIS